jgi:predicted phosphate transport protein (TIGR00153 family)
MAKVRWLKKISLTPKEVDFFAMLRESSANVLEGARALKRLMEDYSDVENQVQRILEIETAGDQITHRIFDKLNKTFITPIESEDIYSLTSKLDDVLDAIEGIASRFLNFRITEPTPEAKDLVDIIYRAAEEINKALGNLKDLDHTLPFCVEVNRLENEADDIVEGMIGKMFEEEEDIRKLLKWKELYSRMEVAADRCEDVANVIEAIVVKNL